MMMLQNYEVMSVKLMEDRISILYSPVGVATGYGLDNQGTEFRFQQGKKCSIFFIFQTSLGAHPPS
jgi:hypothetical protein